MIDHRAPKPPEEPAGHSHRLPSWLIGSILIIGLGLLAGLVLVAQQAIATNNRLTAVEQYVAGKGQQRDAENAALNQRVDDAVCQVLDQLPAGGNLDNVRRRYRCGPGQSAPSSTSPAPTTAPGMDRRTEPPPTGGSPAPQPSPTVATSRSAPPPGTRSSEPPTSAPPRATPHTTSAPATSASPAPANPAPATTSAAPPATPPLTRGPITGLLCGLLPICAPS